VAIKWFLPEEGRPQALKLLDSARSGELRLHVPDLIYCEAGSVLRKKVRRGELTELESAEVSIALLKTEKTAHAAATLLPLALQLASVIPASIHDCFFLALAELLNASFITADTKLTNALAGSHWEQVARSLDSL
jgi:predicted nucleic acid-binding protein